MLKVTLVNKYHPHNTNKEVKRASDLLKVKEEKNEITFLLANLSSHSPLSIFLFLLYHISSTSQILSDKRCFELIRVCVYLAIPLGIVPD